MLDINVYLSKYSNLGLKEKQIKEAFINSIKEICGIDVDIDKVKVSGNYIKLDIQGVEKSEVFINTDRVQELFKEKVEGLGYFLEDKKVI